MCILFCIYSIHAQIVDHVKLSFHLLQLLIPTVSVLKISKEKTARIIPNAVGVVTEDDKHVFCSLLSRDSTYRLMVQVWRTAQNALPNPKVQKCDSSMQHWDIQYCHKQVVKVFKHPIQIACAKLNFTSLVVESCGDSGTEADLDQQIRSCEIPLFYLSPLSKKWILYHTELPKVAILTTTTTVVIITIIKM